jgi:hypothetical protein
VALLLLCVVVAGCFDDYEPTDALRKMPEATLYYPGSKVVDEVANPRNSGPDGQHGASFGHDLAVNATPDEVIAYYDRELTSLGWSRGNGVGGNDLLDASWNKPGFAFVVVVFSAKIPGLPSDLQRQYSGYGLSVSVSLQEDWPTEAPSPRASGQARAENSQDSALVALAVCPAILAVCPVILRFCQAEA